MTLDKLNYKLYNIFNMAFGIHSHGTPGTGSLEARAASSIPEAVIPPAQLRREATKSTLQEAMEAKKAELRSAENTRQSELAQVPPAVDLRHVGSTQPRVLTHSGPLDGTTSIRDFTLRFLTDSYQARSDFARLEKELRLASTRQRPQDRLRASYSAMTSYYDSSRRRLDDSAAAVKPVLRKMNGGEGDQQRAKTAGNETKAGREDTAAKQAVAKERAALNAEVIAVKEQVVDERARKTAAKLAKGVKQAAAENPDATAARIAARALELAG